MRGDARFVKRPQLAVERRRQPRQIGSGRVVAGLLRAFRSGDDRGDRVEIEAPAQGELRHGRPLGHVRLERVGQDDALLEGQPGKRLAHVELLPVAVEIPVIVLGEGRVGAELARQQAAGQGQADDQRHATGPGRVEEHVDRLLPEDVENDLERLDPVVFEAHQRLVDRLDACPECLDLALAFQLGERVEDLAAPHDVGGNAMGLGQVDRLDAQPLERGFGMPEHDVAAEVVGPARVGVAPEFRGHEEPVAVGPFLQEPADERLAAPHPVDVGRVEEGHAGLGRRPERLERLVVAHVAPLGAAELPGPDADLGDPSAGLGELSQMHGDSFRATIVDQSVFSRAGPWNAGGLGGSRSVGSASSSSMV